MTLTVNHKNGSYPVIIKKGAIAELSQYTELDRRVMVITDDGVPREYLKCVLSQCKNSFSIILPQGEESKTLKSFEIICNALLDSEFDRNDLIIGLGGGVVGDLSGFAASCYMRGIDFLNIPTTTLSQIDSSIGGKTAVDFCGVKNCIGSFHQPKAVIVDSDTLKTLPKRHYNNGLVEAVKSGLIRDKALFELFEADGELDINAVIEKSLMVKKSIVEEDENESGVRKFLNFGHTLGHGIESASALTSQNVKLLSDGDFHLLHGEAVAIGILPMIKNDELRKRTRRVFEKLSLPLSAAYDEELTFDFLVKDKKSRGEYITTVRVDEIGCAYLEDIKKSDLFKLL